MPMNGFGDPRCTIAGAIRTTVGWRARASRARSSVCPYRSRCAGPASHAARSGCSSHMTASTPRTRAHTESSYANALEALEPLFARREFVFGDRPTIADIGLMGPFWRHFVHDPTPARLMQDRA